MQSEKIWDSDSRGKEDDHWFIYPPKRSRGYEDESRIVEGEQEKSGEERRTGNLVQLGYDSSIPIHCQNFPPSLILLGISFHQATPGISKLYLTLITTRHLSSSSKTITWANSNYRGFIWCWNDQNTNNHRPPMDHGLADAEQRILLGFVDFE